MSGGAVIEVEGLELFAHHGLLEEERKNGQVFLIDLRLELADCPACESDDINETVDYAAVVDRVEAVATGNRFFLLERLAEAIAADVLERFAGVDRVRVQLAKASPPLPQKLSRLSVAVERRRGG